MVWRSQRLFSNIHVLLVQSHYHLLVDKRASLVAQTVKNLPAMWESQVRYLSQKDPLEKGIGMHSSVLAWRIPWTEKPGRLQSMGWQRDMTEQLTHFHLLQVSS